MRLPSFEYLAPSSLAETLRLLAERAPAAAVLAGGTDLIPRLRHRLVKPGLVLSLSRIPELKEIRLDGLTLKIGAAAVLQEVMDHPEVKAQAPGLAEALRSIGAPNIQHRIGTIGGNLLQNTRCLFYNQSEWWRSGRERCLKNGGQVCHSLPESKECSASCQSDGAAMLSALSVQVELKSAAGERLLPLAGLFSGKGEAPFTLGPDELLTQVQIFLPPPGTGTSYHKLRWRSAIDFPLVSAGASVTLSRGRVDRVRLALGGVGAAPVVVEDADNIFRGWEPTTELIDQAAAAAQKKAEGLIVDNTMAPAEYRRKMVGVMARRALSEAVKRAGVIPGEENGSV